jgi:hypothetical protein
MWKEDAMRAAPNVGKHRTPDEFAAQANPVRDRWRGYARAALSAIADTVPADVSVMAAALRYEKFHEAADMLEAMTAAAKGRRPVEPIRLSSGEPDQRPILGQRGAGLKMEVPEGHGFCRKCGAPMAEGIAMGQTFTPGSPDFPGDKEAVTFSAGGPGEVIRAQKCTACGWSVT